MRIPRQGIVVALAAASQESRFQNYANDGRGGDLRPDQVGIASSLEPAAPGGRHRSRLPGDLPAAVAVVGLDVRADGPGHLRVEVLRTAGRGPGLGVDVGDRGGAGRPAFGVPRCVCRRRGTGGGPARRLRPLRGFGVPGFDGRGVVDRWRRRLAVRCAGRGRRARHDADCRIGSRTPTSTTSATAAGTGRVATPAPTCLLPAVRRSAQRAPAPSSSSGTSPGRGRGSSR